MTTEGRKVIWMKRDTKEEMAFQILQYKTGCTVNTSNSHGTYVTLSLCCFFFNDREICRCVRACAHTHTPNCLNIWIYTMRNIHILFFSVFYYTHTYVIYYLWKRQEQKMRPLHKWKKIWQGSQNLTEKWQEMNDATLYDRRKKHSYCPHHHNMEGKIKKKKGRWCTWENG